MNLSYHCVPVANSELAHGMNWICHPPVDRMKSKFCREPHYSLSLRLWLSPQIPASIKLPHQFLYATCAWIFPICPLHLSPGRLTFMDCISQALILPGFWLNLAKGRPWQDMRGHLEESQIYLPPYFCLEVAMFLYWSPQLLARASLWHLSSPWRWGYQNPIHSPCFS